MTWYVPLPLVGAPRLKYNDPGRDCCWEGEVSQVMTFKNHLFLSIFFSCGISKSSMILDPILTSMAANHWNPKSWTRLYETSGVQLHCDTFWLSKTFSGQQKTCGYGSSCCQTCVYFNWSFHLSLDFHLERLPQIAMNDPLFGGVVLLETEYTKIYKWWCQYKFGPYQL